MVLNDFLLSNLWWIVALGVFVVLMIVMILDITLGRRKRAKKAQAIEQKKSQRAYLEYLGGEENVIDSFREGSRIVVKLHDYSLINREKLEDVGVRGFIMKSDKLTLVVPDNAEEIYNGIFKGEGEL